ncbi:hypothetical protein [Gemmatimonas sp.]|uniref:hypothetical protein n=1 Tax=Gemmatimonas sp. TaxID=1962908 RepID=UPI003983D642
MDEFLGFLVSVLLTLLSPIFLIWMWKNKKFGVRARQGISAAVGLFFVVQYARCSSGRARDADAETKHFRKAFDHAAKNAQKAAAKNAQKAVEPADDSASAQSPSGSAAPTVIAATPLDALATQALTPDAVSDLAKGKEWALYPKGTTECGTLSDGKIWRLDEPDAKDEFKKQDLLDRRAEIAGEVVGKYVKFEGNGDLAGGEVRFGDGEMEISLSAYDFAAQRYTVTIAAQESSKWPVGAESPSFTTLSMTKVNDEEIGSIGGKKLKVKTANTETAWLNGSRFTSPVAVPKAEAATWKDRADAKVLLIQQIIGMGFHKQCKQDCMTVFGTYDCVQSNHGFRDFYRAKTVAYRVTINGKVAAEKQPAVK